MNVLESPKKSVVAEDRRKGLLIERVFSEEGKDPFDSVAWEKRSVEITDERGAVIFRQDDVEVPKSWSMLAARIAASKYFYGEQGTAEREHSVRQIIYRVCRTIADWGVADGYFSKEDGEVFYAELCWLCLHQHGAFNSPVWFNVGLWHEYGAGKDSAQGNWFYDRKAGKASRASTQYEYPQCSACFIQSVDDNMEDIMRLAASEAMLFKHGSGTGTDLTPLRSSKEKLSGGGSPSGPLSFLRVYDQVANVVKSGGKTRRAAKMNTLRDWHGDIEEFIDAKQKEEKKAWALIDAGYDGSYNGDAYGSVMYQNENLSVRVSDEFMQAALDGRPWQTRAVTTGEPLEKKDAAKLLRKIAEGAHLCGDPGVQFDSAIQRWHTCKGTAPIHSTNPCSEYVFLDNTACNLASLNLMKFSGEEGFDADRFRAAVRVFITAQEILVDNASYPTPAIAENSHIFRTLGLGYANLGALIMSYGLPYDSREGRALAGSVTAIMTGEAYVQSAAVAAALGPFQGWRDAKCAGVDRPASLEGNADSMKEVARQHREAVETIEAGSFDYLKNEARACWKRAEEAGGKHGFRNAQVTVLAPTGTISFMMDCDTTGIEPDIALAKYKLLAGGGMLKIVNQTVPQALRRLGYEERAVRQIIAHVEERDTIEDVRKDGSAVASGLKPEHLQVFDCAFKPFQGTRSIPYSAHLKMMAAAQPFISGAISKTVNLPNSCSAAEIQEAYAQAWRLGLKCVAVYRDGSKRSQPLNTSKSGEDSRSSDDLLKQVAQLEARVASLKQASSQPARRRLPATRIAKTHKFDIAGHEGYLTVGLFDDGSPGELFITMAKEGSTIGGLMDTIGTLTSMALQYGVPLDILARKFSHHRFEPSGWTKNPNIRQASSITDYVFRWMSQEFTAPEDAGESDQVGLGMPGLEAEVKKKVNRPVPDLPLNEESEISQNSNPTRPTSLSPAPRRRNRINSISDTVAHFQQDAPICPCCGHVTVRNGACYKCMNCGESLGCS